MPLPARAPPLSTLLLAPSTERAEASILSSPDPFSSQSSRFPEAEGRALRASHEVGEAATTARDCSAVLLRPGSSPRHFRSLSSDGEARLSAHC
jgi:hypothetical protein